MFHKPLRVPTWQLFILAFGIFTAVGALHSTHAQPLPDAPNAKRLPDPKVDNKYINHLNPLSKRTLIKLSPLEEKRRAIEQAIYEGNEARQNSDYEKALANYQRVIKQLDPKEPRAFYGLGNVYSDLMCNDNAIKAYSDALRLKPDLRDAVIGLGHAYTNVQRYQEAETTFRRLSEKNSNDVAARLGLAFTALKLKNYQNAITQLKGIINSRSLPATDRAEANRVLGEVYIEQKRWVEAEAALKEALVLNPDLAGAYIGLARTALYPAMSKFSLLVVSEARIEDREELIKAAKYATQNLNKAINELKFNHPIGYLLLSQAMKLQFRYRDALDNIQLYLNELKELERRASFLATNCNSGFKQLYAFGYLWFALVYDRQAALETDVTKKAEYHDRVIENVRELLKIKDDEAGAYSLLGQTYLLQKKYLEAVQQLEKAISFETDAKVKASLRGLIAVAYSRLGRDDEAMASFKNSLELDPDSITTRLGAAEIFTKRGELDEAIKLQREVIALMKEPTASSHWMLAGTYFSRARAKKVEADFEEAISLLKKAIEINRTFAPAYYLLGQVYKFYKDGSLSDEALKNLEMAARYDPQNATVQLQIGDLYFAIKKNHDAGIMHLRQAIKLNPNLVYAHWLLGLIYYEKKNETEALKHLQEAIKSDERFLDAYILLITIYKSQKNYPEAIKHLNKVLEINPKSFYPYKELAKLYEAQQNNEEAIRYYEQAIPLLERDDTFGKELYVCRIKRLRSQYDEAIACFQRLKPPSSEDQGQPAYDIGLTYVASKNKNAAVAEYERLKEMKSPLAEELLRAIDNMK